MGESTALCHPQAFMQASITCPSKASTSSALSVSTVLCCPQAFMQVSITCPSKASTSSALSVCVEENGIDKLAFETICSIWEEV